jgi:predicted MFS family arabinose efflux permease
MTAQQVLEFGPARRDRCRMRNVPRPLALLVSANAVSLSGNVVLTVAVPWLVLARTGSATLAATAVFVGVAGAALGGLAAGRVVDAIGAVRTGSLADVANALVVAPLPLLLAFDLLEIWHVLLLGFLGTMVDSAASTARQTLVPAVADARGYPRERANALFTSAEHVGYLLGAPLAGVLIASFGVGFAISVTVAAFVFAGLTVGRLHVSATHLAVDQPTGTSGAREAIVFIWDDLALRTLFLFPTVAVMLVAPLVPLVLPVLARESFGDPVVLGVMVASYGVGGLLGAAGFGVLGGRVSRRWLFVGVFALVPATLAGITLSPSVPFTIAMLVTLGAAAGSLVPLMATIRQERSPAQLLPRIVGLSTATVPVTGPVGVLATGVLIDALGLERTLLLTTALAAVIAAAAWASRGPRLFDGPTAPQRADEVPVVPVVAG